MDPRVETLQKTVSVNEFCERFFDGEKFALACARCPGYGRTWACPPYDFDPIDLWRSYNSFLLYAKKVFVPDELRNVEMEAAELAESYHELLAPVKAQLMDELFALENEHEGSLALSGGGCDICAECARDRGEPCVCSERMRYSVESLGGDVGGSLGRWFGEKLLWAEGGHLPEYFIIMGGLLMK